MLPKHHHIRQLLPIYFLENYDPEGKIVMKISSTITQCINRIVYNYTKCVLARGVAVIGSRVGQVSHTFDNRGVRAASILIFQFIFS